uniref:Exonuclease domain-containing protein n=1 Tax=Pseudo-nitzschia australis TaxID=44445 RepID=A0A7S4ERM6_9STRA
MSGTTGSPPFAPVDNENDGIPEKNANYFEALSDTVEENKSAQDPAVLLARKKRKKLKKLKKRAGLVQTSCERSGLLTRSEYDEYQDLIKSVKEDDALHNPPSDRGKDDPVVGNNDVSMPPPSSLSSDSSLTLVGPTINLRKKCIGIETVEGVTHRDLLSFLLQQKNDGWQQKSKASSSSSNLKKRQRDEDGEESRSTSAPKANAVSIPHWVSIHNPGACEQVAVLEVQVPDDKIELYSEFLKSCVGSKSDAKDQGSNNSSDSNTLNHSFTKSQVGVGTKWFQGYLPKSMSESLLYFSNVKKEQKSKKIKDELVIPSMKEFTERLKAMLLSTEEMNEQGYPKALPSSIHQESIGAAHNKDDDVAPKKEKLHSPDSIPWEMAKDYVGAFGVRVEEQNEKDESAYIGTPDNKSNWDVASHDDHPVRVFGVDCEMVMTTLGSELARVTLLQFDGFVGPKTNSKTTVLLDCLVHPQNRIVDYLTKHSGITPKLLEPVSTRLEQVQYALGTFLTPKDIIIGHSLENDLRALHYIHPRVIDTSIIFRPADKNKRFKFSLRHLSNTLLKKQIQTGSHCSEEDAQTTLDLALLKALKGDDLQVPGYGDNQRRSLLQQKFVQDSIAAFIGPSSWLEAHITKYPNGAHALSYDSPNDVKKAMLAWMTNNRKAHLIWSNIELGNNSNSGSDSSIESFKSLVVSCGPLNPERSTNISYYC